MIGSGLILGVASFLLRHGRRSEEESRAVRLLLVVPPNLVTALLLLATGISLVAGRGGGLYWAVPAVLAAFVGGVTNAWLFMIRLPRERAGSAAYAKQHGLV